MENLIVTSKQAPSKIQLSTKYLIDELIPIFWHDVQVAESSKRVYGRSLKIFTNWLLENGIERIDRRTIIDYKTSLDGRQLSVATKQNYFVAVKVLFEWLSNETNDICPNFTSGIKVPKVGKTFKKKALGAEQSAGLIKSIDVNTDKGKRDLAVIALMLFCGLRCVEIQRANVGDLDSKLEFLSVQGKGKADKTDRVRIGDKLRKILQMYLSTIDTSDKSQALFRSKARRNLNQRMTTRSISGIVKNALRRYGIDDRSVTAHSLRHTSATIALKQGLPIDEVSKAMRHASINTTMIYNHAISEENNRSEETIENAIFGKKESKSSCEKLPLDCGSCNERTRKNPFRFIIRFD